jgi:hypothetical protein
MESGPSRYCLKCGYALVVATDNQCPECGQEFHPNHPITFAVKSPTPRLKQWAISFTWALVCSSIFVLLLSLLPEADDDHGVWIMIACLIVLGLSIATYALTSPSFTSLTGTATGVFWGFLITLSIATSLQNQRVSVNWPAFIPALIILPAAGVLLASPFWLFTQRRLKFRRNRILAEHSSHK